MIKFNKNKRGDDKTTALIVTLAVLIVSFIIILLFLNVLNPSKTSDQEVCHNSVTMRSAGFLTQQAIPLNCKTSYVCISQDGTCKSMTNPEIVKVNTADEFYNALATQMYDCWWMFGEGKLDYIGNAFSYDSYCSICSQVAFDDSLQKIFPKTTIRNAGIAGQSANNTEIYWRINKEDFYDYLANTNVSGKDITYLDYFLGIKNTKTLSDVLQANNGQFGTINLESRYLVVMSEFSSIGTFQNILLGIAKGILLFAVLPIPIVGGPLAEAIVASTIIGTNEKYFVGTIITGESGHGYLTPTLIEASSEEYSQLKCADVKTLA